MATKFSGVSAREGLIDEAPQSAGTAIDQLWRREGCVSGSLRRFVNAGAVPPRLDLLQTMQVVAMSTDDEPDLVCRLVEAATIGPGDIAGLHAAASLALTRPATMRWVSANADHVATSPNWQASLAGLGGATVSVPLAEEALSNLLAVRSDLPVELTDYVQLNPWFSRRFAARYGRRMGGRRLRLRDRGATARAWSHARTLLGPQLPPQWCSLHGRGAGRPIDEWSRQLLTRYANLLLNVYQTTGIPPVMAPLFTIASVGVAIPAPPEELLAQWHTLPADVEQAARRLMSLHGVVNPSSGLQAL